MDKGNEFSNETPGYRCFGFKFENILFVWMYKQLSSKT